MKNVLSLLLAALLTLSLCGCQPAEKPGGLVLYAPPRAGGDAIQSLRTLPYEGELSLDGLLDALLQEVFSGAVSLRSWSHDGVALKVDLSEEYRNLAGIDLTLAECSIVLTLCQLEGVERVQITAAGRPVSGRAHQFLSPEHMIFTGAEEEPRQMSVVLYFPRSGGRGLGFELRELTLTEDDDLYLTVTRELLAGPAEGGHSALFPEGVQLLGTRVENGVCRVDFSAQLLSEELSDPQRDLLLFSIVDTLGNLESVHSVQLLVEGSVVPFFGSSDTSLPLKPDFGLVAD